MRKKCFYVFGYLSILIFFSPSFAFAYNGYDTKFLLAIISIFIVLVVFFLIARELFCWYWKINERVALLREIKSLLKNISKNEILSSNFAENKNGESNYCVDCGAKLELGEVECRGCGLEMLEIIEI